MISSPGRKTCGSAFAAENSPRFPDGSSRSIRLDIKSGGRRIQGSLWEQTAMLRWFRTKRGNLVADLVFDLPWIIIVVLVILYFLPNLRTTRQAKGLTMPIRILSIF